MTVQGQKKTFPKVERLSGKKSIEELFQKGSSFYLHPFLLKYTPTGEAHHQVLISVSKKKFKRAVHRNLIKRRIREAYRLNKHHLVELNTFYNLAIIYLDSTILSYKDMEGKLIQILSRLKTVNPKANEK